MESQDIKEIELNMEAAKEIVARADALDRLSKNKDFEEIVFEGFFKDNAVRLVHLKSAYEMRDEDNQAAIDKEISAIGIFQQYLDGINYQADMASAALKADAETLSELLEEDEG